MISWKISKNLTCEVRDTFPQNHSCTCMPRTTQPTPFRNPEAELYPITRANTANQSETENRNKKTSQAQKAWK